MMGNSYTYYNGGVNGVLLQLLAALGDSPRVQALTKGGSSLNYHWQEVSSPSSGHHVALASGFDFVVLQDRSDIPSRCCYTDQDEDFEASTRALVQLDAAIKEAGRQRRSSTRHGAAAAASTVLHTSSLFCQ